MGASLPPLHFSYQNQSLEALLADSTVLAVFGFGSAAPAHADPRYMRVGLEPLEADAPFEVWRSTRPVRSGQDGAVRYAADGDYLYGALEIEENAGDIDAAAADAYRQLCAFNASQPYAAVLRIWNYMDAINEGEGDEERYRRFCIGRARGMGGSFGDRYPAGTAIGRQDGRRILQVYWLAARVPGQPVENPRQVSAYRYPRQYGPTPPAFARAMLTSARQLLISGTAAVVGHASQHIGDEMGQVEETLRNVDSLIGAAGVAAPDAQTLFKLYVREADNAAPVAAALRARLPECPVLVLAGDVCRRELLLEVDCTRA